MRWLLRAAVAASLVAAPAAARSSYPVLWSVRDDGSHRTAVEVLPVEGTIVDRSATGRLAVLTDEGLSLVDPDGARGVRVPDASRFSSASFSPDGRFLLYATPSDTLGASVLRVVGEDGAGARVVASDGGMGAWSPDARRIAFVGGVSQKTQLGRLYVVSALGGARRGVARGAYFGLGGLGAPAFSPDGRAIAFGCANSRGGAICVTRSGKTRRFTHAGLGPMWAPGGRRIAATLIGDGNVGVAVTDVVRGTVRTAGISPYRGVDDVPLAWAPDGSRLAYARSCGGGRFIPAPCKIMTLVYDVEHRTSRRISVDGVPWSVVRWRGRTLTYVTNPP
jgi:Tol biopolymer transport system component